MKFRTIIAFATLLFLFSFNANSAVITQSESPLQLVEQEEITDAQLRKFASAIFSLRQIDQNARTEMGKLIQEQGMELEKFNEIYRAKQNPAAELNLSEQVEQQYEKIMNELEGLQQDYLQKKQNAVADAGLEFQTFETIANRIQTDPELRQRLAVMLEDFDLR